MNQEQYLTFDEFNDVLLSDDDIYNKFYQYKKEYRECGESNFEFYDRKREYINKTFVPNLEQKIPIELKFDSEKKLNQIVEQIITELDDYARNVDSYDFGLPLWGDGCTNDTDMKQIVTNILLKQITT